MACRAALVDQELINERELRTFVEFTAAHKNKQWNEIKYKHTFYLEVQNIIAISEGFYSCANE